MRAQSWTLAVMLAVPLFAQRGVVTGVTVPKSVEAGGPVDITVTGTNPCGGVRLDYGDGTERIAHAITHIPTTVKYVYKQPGKYRIVAEGMGNCDGVAETSLQVIPQRTPPPQPAPPRVAPQPQIRFREMDDDRDGVITRAEWRGNRQSFRQHDTNGDGVLSGEEVRVPLERAGPDEVLVRPTVRWTDTGLYVREGELLRIESAGTVQLSTDNSDNADPGGAYSGRVAPSAPLNSRPAGALIARIGDSAPLFVGNDRTLRAPASGQLYLGVNDDHLADNRGEFRVRVRVDRAGRQGRR